jgi:uncharacterized protein (TIGR02270 family)
LIVQKSSFAVNAADLLFRKVGISHANQLIRNFSGNTEKHRITIDAYKALGDPQSIPILIDFMSVDKHARAAGEAFSFITGLDIAYEDLETDMPAGFEAGPTDDPEDENVEMDPDEDLPWPDAELIQRWWHDRKDRFKAGTRYLAGLPITEENCRHVLIHGYQRQRMAAALELALMNPGRPLFETRAPGFRQQRLLGLRK